MRMMVFAIGQQRDAWPGYWQGGWPWWGLVWLLVALLFWGGLVALLVWAVRSAAGGRHAPDSALRILRRRLANGEITQEEYERIRQLLQD